MDTPSEVIGVSFLRVKVLIPPGHKDSPHVVDELFRESCEGTEMQPLRERDLQEIAEGRTHSYEMDYELRLDDSRTACKVLMDIACRFFRKARRPSKEFEALPRHMMPYLFISSPKLFVKKCIPFHEFKVTSLFFGNVINSGAFATHWTVEFGKRPNLFHDKITVSLEYDRSDIRIKFMHKNVKFNKEEEHTIRIAMVGIRRIIVDPVAYQGPLENYPPPPFRVFLQLTNPPLVFRYMDTNTTGEKKDRFGDGDRVTTMNRGTDDSGYSKEESIAGSTCVCLQFPPHELDDTARHDLLSRLRFRSGVPIEIVTMDIIEMLIGKGWPYIDHPTSGPAFERRIRKVNKPNVMEEDDFLKDDYKDEFRVRFLIDALLSRGAIVKDQLLVSHEVWSRFIESIVEEFKKDDKACLRSLERVVAKVDEMTRRSFIHRMFIEELELCRPGCGVSNFMEEEEEPAKREGYLKVRKVVITPTRMICIPPETIMGNRALRKLDPNETRIIRITFRDDDTRQMNTMSTGKGIIEKTVGEALKNGIFVGGRRFLYLGSSNSQMRDHGAYFYYTGMFVPTRKVVSDYEAAERLYRKKSIHKARCKFGSFENLKSVPKFMARMGQCFTQSQAVTVNIKRDDREITPDFIGGNNSENSEPFTFSDGVGQISDVCCKLISEDLNLSPGTPCVYQFRHRGCKGVLAVHLGIDKLNELWTELGIPKQIRCRFRPSQEKFKAPEGNFEVVKYSAPIPVSLNKPFINILDQVSEMQSLECHRQMCYRIHELLDDQLRSMAETLIDERACRIRLKELPRRVSIDLLSQVNGFSLTTEPFFRSMLKAAVRYTIMRQLNKQQIQIPYRFGRSMFGVVDETGILQYGQVFIQFHEQITEKLPRKNAMKIVHKGKVLLTKNPCIVSGDVRVFEAVDVPDLHHLVDVIVFPQHGPRPHPDEMAGSDLDGDEYSVIWDPLLFLDHNEPAMQFPSSTGTIEIKPDLLDEQMKDFYIKYLQLNSIGAISLAHLTNSDLYGIESEVCDRIAKKNAMALDFPKTGSAPAELEKKWQSSNKKGCVAVPPEKPERRPDFMQKTHEPCYASTRLIGRIFRQMKFVEEALAISEERDSLYALQPDKAFECDDWESVASIPSALHSYNNEIRGVMENYGIHSEGELMSGCFSQIRNRLSDRDGDDMSFFNTNQVIETKVSTIMRKFRELFFEEFGGFKMVTVLSPDKIIHNENDVYDRIVTTPLPDMRKKAIAAYRRCYELASRESGSGPRLLSFAWLAFDVLAVMKKEYQRDYAEDGFSDPIEPIFAGRIHKWKTANEKEFTRSLDFWLDRGAVDGKGDDDEGTDAEITRIMLAYKGLPEAVFAIVGWARQEKVFKGNFTEKRLVQLIITFGAGDFLPPDKKHRAILHAKTGVSEGACLSCPGRFFLSFITFIAARPFLQLKNLSLSRGRKCCLNRGEWVKLHQAGVKAYYSMVFSLKINLYLPGESDDSMLQIREMHPFVIELPEKVDLDEVAEQMRRYSGAASVKLRRLATFGRKRVVVSALGPLPSHSRLSSLVIVEPLRDSGLSEEQLSNEMPTLVYKRILRADELAEPGIPFHAM